MSKQRIVILPALSGTLTWILFANAIAAVLAGCANPGQPRPPSLHLPSPATGLKAERTGPIVQLTWSTPAESTDGEPLKGALTASICREIVTQHASQTCAKVLAVQVHSGPSSAEDRLPAALLTDPAALLIYQVQLLNTAGRGVPSVSFAYSASGAAPPPVGTLHIAPSRRGALITWQATSDPSPVELRRTLLAAAPGFPQARPSARDAASPAKPSGAQVKVATLRADEVSGEVSAGDPGGLRDPGVSPLASYSYTAQRVRTLILLVPEGRGKTTSASVPARTISVELRGIASPATSFTFRDTFPPHAPVGVMAISNGGDPRATPFQPASVDLSWEAGPEPDLTGYNVYRAESPEGPYLRLNKVALPGPAFRDKSVLPGGKYRYRVTAVDQTGNESLPSTSLAQTVPLP